MAADLRPGIVRILDTNGETASTGFVVTEEGLIATCAHVVDDAGSGPGGTVSLVFHATGEEREATVNPEYWTDSNAQDVTILKPKGPLPESVEPLLLGSSPGSEDHPFRTFGFPEQKPEEGTPGGGTFLQWTTENGFDVLTLRSPEVARGFSGAPALDDTKRCVVGMVVSIAEVDRSGRGSETGYAIPTETLAEVCPTVRSQLEQFVRQELASQRRENDERQEQAINGLIEDLEGRKILTPEITPRGLDIRRPKQMIAAIAQIRERLNETMKSVDREHEDYRLLKEMREICNGFSMELEALDIEMDYSYLTLKGFQDKVEEPHSRFRDLIWSNIYKLSVF